MADNTPAQPGTAAPGTPTPNPGTDGSPTTNPDYLTKAEFGRSAAMIRGLDDSLKALQGNMITLETLATLGLFDVEEVEGKKQYKPKGSTPPVKVRADDDPLFQRVKTLEGQLEKARKEKDASDTAVEESKRDTALIEALREAGALNPQRDFMHLKSRVLKNDTGYFAKGTDEAGYDVEVKLTDLAKEFLKANPELKKAGSAGGAGTAANGQTVAPGVQLRPGQTMIPKAQWQDMNWFMTNKSKFDAGEYLRGQ